MLLRRGSSLFHRIALGCLLTSSTFIAAAEPVVIAHRGASGYLPEHTIPAKVMAHALGADFLEQDCVLTKDDIPIVLHDIHLDRVTDVAERFPTRKREDGRYYAIDFTWNEIRTLSVTERLNEKGEAVFPKRFPVRTGVFHIPSLDEELTVIAGLNRSTGRTAGVYPEIKQPAFHRKEGRDISRIVLDVLTKHGYRTKSDPCYVQCFDRAETRRIREELGCQLCLTQLLEGDQWKAATANVEVLRKELADIAEYANGIGPSLPHVLTRDAAGKTTVSPLFALAKEHNLTIHSFTLRFDDVPKEADNWEDLHRVLVQAGIDGAFCDFPDKSKLLFRQFAREE